MSESNKLRQQVEDDPKIIELISARIKAAEDALIYQYCQDIFSGDSHIEVIPPKRFERIKRLLCAPYFWLRWRIVGTWNVWTKGECGDCDCSDW